MGALLLGFVLPLLQGPPAPTWWTAGGAPTPLARQALALLQEAGAHGLLPPDYDLAHLEQSAAALASSRSRALEDVACPPLTLLVVARTPSTLRSMLP